MFNPTWAYTAKAATSGWEPWVLEPKTEEKEVDAENDVGAGSIFASMLLSDGRPTANSVLADILLFQPLFPYAYSSYANPSSSVPAWTTSRSFATPQYRSPVGPRMTHPTQGNCHTSFKPSCPGKHGKQSNAATSVSCHGWYVGDR